MHPPSHMRVDLTSMESILMWERDLWDLLSCEREDACIKNTIYFLILKAVDMYDRTEDSYGSLSHAINASTRVWFWCELDQCGFSQLILLHWCTVININVIVLYYCLYVLLKLRAWGIFSTSILGIDPHWFFTFS